MQLLFKGKMIEHANAVLACVKKYTKIQQNEGKDHKKTITLQPNEHLQMANDLKRKILKKAIEKVENIEVEKMSFKL